MKVVIGYPPLKSKKGIPLIGQNRQFQWVHTPWTAYPMVPAYAVTLLKKAGYQVFWLDGIWEKQSYQQWEKELLRINPDLLMLETKTPVVKRHWSIINKLKIANCLPASKAGKLKIVLVGDHVTALPEESFKNSLVDYILTGGDYDFLLLNLCNHLSKGEKLKPGIWYREKPKTKNQKPKTQTKNEKILNTGKFRVDHDLNSLPLIDRDLTKWRLYAFQNTNYLRPPGTYTMFARDCWWGKCSFCSWPATLYPVQSYRVISPKRALDEIGYLTQNYPFKEIMDDSGTFPTGDWLREFCQGMIERGYNREVRINCNMRFNSGLTQKDYHLMANAGFRFLLFGLESANQETLDKINKNLKVEQVEPVLKMVKKAGLWPHITVMVGYPWEGKKEVNKTIRFVKKLAQKGLFNSMQATLVIPYPGTPLFNQCKEKGLLKTLDWDRYDMREPVIKAKVADEELMTSIRKLYHVSIWNKTFLFNTITQLKTLDGSKYVCFQALKYFGKLLEFRSEK